jgi:AAA family ATP:ADP antiporter
MATINDSYRRSFTGLLRTVVAVERDEIAALLASFVMFFSVLAAYYIVRPVRDEIGVALDKNKLFTTVFIVMLIAVPVFGWIAARLPRRYVLPAIYLFFAADLLGFWLDFRAAGTGAFSASLFFVWASVFNLFVVSLFWSLMAELWSNEEAKRLYGFISAGGTAGALAGPVLTNGLIRLLQPVDLLLASCLLLLAAMAASLVLRAIRPGHGNHDEQPAGGGILDGAAKLLQSPYLARIALFVFLANVVGTFFYLEQSRIVGNEIADKAERIRFFTGRDFVVSCFTIAVEILGTAQVLRRFGVGAALLALPIAAGLGTLALGITPTLLVAAGVMVAERVAAFALAGPAIKVMYTLTTPDEKYKVQNFIDTVVYRGGDAASGWLYAMIAGGAGFASAITPLVAAPLVLSWLAVASAMGREHKARSQSASASG